MAYDYHFKCTLVGDPGVGKSALSYRFTNNHFSEFYEDTLGVQFANKGIKHNNKNIKLQIWDTTGNEKFRKATSSYYRGAHIILCVFDATNRKSFEKMSAWLEATSQENENAVKILVGNKYDLKDQIKVTEEEAAEFAKDFNHFFNGGFFPVSAKTGFKVEELFENATAKALEKENPSENVLELAPPKKEQHQIKISTEELRKEYRAHASTFSIRYFLLFFNPFKNDQDIRDELSQRALTNKNGASAKAMALLKCE